MKKIKTLSLFLIVILLGCGGNDSDTPQATGDGVFKASIAGATMTSDASEARAVHTKGFGGADTYALYVQGLDKLSKKMINFTILSNAEHSPGTSSITLISSNQAYYIENKDAAGEKVWIAPDGTNSDVNISHGTVTVTEITSTRVKGTFSFTGRESGGSTTRAITSGSFDTPLKKQGF